MTDITMCFAPVIEPVIVLVIVPVIVPVILLCLELFLCGPPLRIYLLGNWVGVCESES